MRFTQIFEAFEPGKVYLHGGPSELVGGSFKRYAKGGGDSGALFFIEESPTGYKYALGYAISKFRDGGVWRVKLNLDPSRVFDFTNQKHRKIAKDNLSDQEYESWISSAGKSGHLDWTVIDEDLMEEWGFDAIMLHERTAGFAGMDDHAISVGVFDASKIQIIDFIPKKELLQKYS